MIIFDYATLACDSHRQHFIEIPWDQCIKCYDLLIRRNPLDDTEFPSCECGRNPFTWEQDWKAYYREAVNDKPIKLILEMCATLRENFDFEIWIDIPYIYQHGIETFLENYLKVFRDFYKIKMRPEGDATPWHEIKEKWIADTIIETKCCNKVAIEMALERSGSPMIEIWKKYGVPVFEVHV